MKILLIEAGTIEAEWLAQYVARYDSSTSIVGTKSMAEAAELIKNRDGVDIIILDPKVHDALSPGGISGITIGTPTLPIAILETGKVLHQECIRMPQTRLYHIRTDVSTNAFLTHLKNIVEECALEDKQKSTSGNNHG